MFKNTCFDILQQETKTFKLKTLCKGLDCALAGGLAPGKITELTGAPGSGKTQMCMQMTIIVQFPKEVGGLDGKAVYIDTNQDFSPLRMKEMADFNGIHIPNEAPPKQLKLDVNSLLENVLYMYCSNYVELLAIVILLRDVCKKDSTIRLILIDSFSFPLRRTDGHLDQRTWIVNELLSELQKLAFDFEIVIILTNELTTRTLENDWKICPALGDGHAHKINQRIILSKERNSETFVAYLDKSIISKKMAIPFQIKQNGLCDL